MGYLYALLTALLWGMAPLFGKLGLESVDALAAMTLRTMVVGVVLLLFGGFTGQLANVTSIGLKAGLLIAAEGLLASLLGHLAYYQALKLGDASRVVPVTAAFPLVTVLMAILFFGEPLTWQRVLGAALVVGGVLLIKG
mgnify:CR=1 FL=1